MTTSELSTLNYKRIFAINCLICVPLFLIFAWPYVVFGQWLAIQKAILYPGALFFGFPFMVTLLHGHVDLALGSAHRHHYYNWLKQRTLTYGLLYHPILVSTRFRLVIFTISLIAFIAGVFVTF